MNLPVFRFKHIPQLLSAWVLWLLLFAFISFNWYAAAVTEPTIKQALPVLLRPFQATVHLGLAQSLWRKGLTAEAIHEAKLAQELESRKNVLGATSQITTLLNYWESEPEKLKQLYATWKQITLEKPDYADAFLMAGIYAYQLGNTDEAKQLINQARTRNPVSPAISRFVPFVQ